MTTEPVSPGPTLSRSKKKVATEGFTLLELLISTAILTIVLGSITTGIVSIQRGYTLQNRIVEAQDNARLALETMVRLVRVAGNDPQELAFQALDPDPDGNSQLDDIRLRADWNPADGDLDDPREDIIFSTSSDQMFKEEPGDGGPLVLADRIQSVAFTYRDKDNVVIADPIANSGSIALVEIVLTTSVPDVPDLTYGSSATLRARE